MFYFSGAVLNTVAREYMAHPGITACPFVLFPSWRTACLFLACAYPRVDTPVSVRIAAAPTTTYANERRLLPRLLANCWFGLILGEMILQSRGECQTPFYAWGRH
jgi:hypothetical protein